MDDLVERLDVRMGRPDDAGPLAAILNEHIAAGGATALEDPLSDEAFADAFLTGPDSILCCVAVERATKGVAGFQALGRRRDLPADWADIATFARRRAKPKGVGAALFRATSRRAGALGLRAINAAIRADNAVGLAYYRKIGFTPYRTISAVPLKGGATIDRILMRFDIVDHRRLDPTLGSSKA